MYITMTKHFNDFFGDRSEIGMSLMKYATLKWKTVIHVVMLGKSSLPHFFNQCPQSSKLCLVLQESDIGLSLAYCAAQTRPLCDRTEKTF